MKYDSLNRRQFLQGLAGTLVACPLLPSLLPSRAQAAMQVSPKFFGLFWDNGIQHEQWYPKSSQFAGGLLKQGSYRYGDLRKISGNISENFGAEISAYREHLLILQGLTHLDKGTHNDRVFLTGQRAQGAPSLDQILAWNAKSNAGSSLAERALNMVALPKENSSGYYRRGSKALSYAPTSATANGYRSVTADSSLVLPIDDPLTVFEKIFGVTTQPQMTDGRIHRRKVVDFVLEDYNRIKNGRLIASEDKMILERHMNLLSELQNTLPTENGTSSQQGCGLNLSKAQYKTTTQFQGGEQGDYPTAVRNMIRLAAAAFACGITNVSTLMFTDENSDSPEQFKHLRFIDSDLSVGTPIDQSFHGIAHLGSDSDYARHAAYRSIIRYFTQSIGLFLSEVSQYTTANGDSLINHVLAYGGSTLAHGNRHDNIDMPVILAGSAGGALNTGYYVDYRDQSLNRNVQGRPYNELLVTILQSMGLGPSDYETSPGAGFGNYKDLSDFSRHYVGISSANARNATLPFVFNG